MRNTLKSYLRPLLHKLPFIHSKYLLLKKHMLSQSFESSSQYWENRYQAGYNSGDGSYAELANYKSNFLNSFVLDNKIKLVAELGCGDGNQLSMANYPSYVGFDISSKAVEMCKNNFSDDSTKQFFQMQDENCPSMISLAELCLSLDVIYHLVEEDVFEEYMKMLFSLSTKYVIVYSSNSDGKDLPTLPHVKHRHFSKWIEENISGWVLSFSEKNKYPYTGDIANTPYSFADFFVFRKT